MEVKQQNISRQDVYRELKQQGVLREVKHLSYREVL